LPSAQASPAASYITGTIIDANGSGQAKKQGASSLQSTALEGVVGTGVRDNNKQIKKIQFLSHYFVLMLFFTF
jgi:hypothetical protein